MIKLRFEEKLMTIIIFFSLIILILGVSNPKGCEFFLRQMILAILIAFSIFITIKHQILNRIFGRIIFLTFLILFISLFVLLLTDLISIFRYYYFSILTLILFPLFVFLLNLKTIKSIINDSSKFIRDFWVYIIFVPTSLMWLKVLTFMTPITFDNFFKKIDTLMFGFYPDQYIKQFMTNDLTSWFSLFYSLLPFFPVILGVILYIKKENFQFRRVTLSFLLCGIVGWFFYLVFPAIGPKYIEIKSGGYFSPFILRNCFPSLHTSWGLLVLIYAFKYKKKVFWYFLFPISQMILGTMLLRYHYIIDIIAAIPFTAFIYWLTNKTAKKHYSNVMDYSIVDRIKIKAKKYEYLIIFIFILSGMTALIYEMYFLKKMSLIFGSTAMAVSTVLTSFMLGLALGNWFGGKLSDRVKSPIKVYGYAELFVGLISIISPFLFKQIEMIYVYIGKNWEISSLTLTIIRVVLASLIVLLPAMAMGATLPLLIKYITTKGEKITKSIASLYSANLIGAAIGVFLATYFLIPTFGLVATISFAVIVNFSIALISLQLSKKIPKRIEVKIKEKVEKKVEEKPEIKWHFFTPRSLNHMLILAALFLGFTSFAGEVIWTHLLAMIAGNSVYAFGIMLFSVLIGLSCGGYIVSRSKISDSKKLIYVGFFQLSIACFLLLQLWLWDKIPPYLGHMGVTTFKFAQREFVRFFISFSLLIIPTLLIGLSFPFLASLFSRNLKTLGTKVGKISFFNTIGNILGSVIAGFLLLPLIGSYKSIIFIVLLAIINGIMLLNASILKQRKLVSICFTLIFIFTILYFPSWNITNLSMGTNVYFTKQHLGKVIDWWEEKDGGFTTVTEEIEQKSQKKKLTLWTNGKFQGDNTREMQAQHRFALYPILFVKKRIRALVIGLGTGASARVVEEAGFKDIEIAELSSGIVKAAKKYYSTQNNNILSNPKTKLFVTDGRNLLLLNKNPYDLITMEISSIWFAGAASLYSVEFYELAKKNLKKDGIFQQWIQLHHISKFDVLCIISSVRMAFKHVKLFFGGNQGVIVASKRPLKIQFKRLMEFNQSDQFSFLKQISPFENFFCLLGEELLGEDGINHFLLSHQKQLNTDDLRDFISTDDNLFLEYSTPKGNIDNYYISLVRNLRLISIFKERNNKTIKNIPSEGWEYYVSGCLKIGSKRIKEGLGELKKSMSLIPDNKNKIIKSLIEKVEKTPLKPSDQE